MRWGSALICIALGGCAIEASVPVTGQLNKTAAIGQATARSSGEGDFWVQVPGGVRCSGTYDSLTEAPAITAPIRCSDGRTGEAVIARRRTGSGTAIIALSDGTKGQFVFGDLKFEQAFGDGGAATTEDQDRRRR